MNIKEIRLSYDPATEKEWLPQPKFDGIYWQGMPNEGEVEGQVIKIYGESWALDHVGFQGSIGMARVRLHEEPTQQEDVFFLSGEGEMTIWNGLDCGRERKRTEELKGIFTKEELQAATFVLAVASYSIPHLDNVELEHLVLNVEVNGRHESIEPVSTPRGFHHGYDLSEESHYLVVKRRKLEPLVS